MTWTIAELEARGVQILAIVPSGKGRNGALTVSEWAALVDQYGADIVATRLENGSKAICAKP